MVESCAFTKRTLFVGSKKEKKILRINLLVVLLAVNEQASQTGPRVFSFYDLSTVNIY